MNDVLVDEAKKSVADWVPGFVTNTVTGERLHFGGLSPRQVPVAWLNGLKAAQVRGAQVAKVYRNSWQTLPLVLQFDCPSEHVDDSRERFAKVRLLVDPYTAWVSLHEDSCGRCSLQQVESFLITCPRCADPDSEHEEHIPLYLQEGDESPVGFVIEEMALMLEGRKGATGSESDRVAWTLESAVAWLNNLVKEDGSYVVPPTMGQAAAWEVVRGILPHPSQVLLRDAQAARKRAATKPPEG